MVFCVRQGIANAQEFVIKSIPLSDGWRVNSILSEVKRAKAFFRGLRSEIGEFADLEANRVLSHINEFNLGFTLV